MADLVGQGLAPVVVQTRVDVGGVAVVDQVPRGAIRAARVVLLIGAGQVGKGSGTILAGAVVAEGHVEVAARGSLGEGDIGHIGPGLHGQYGLAFCRLLNWLNPEMPCLFMVAEEADVRKV